MALGVAILPWAANADLSYQGYTGVFNVPTSDVTPFGIVELQNNDEARFDRTPTFETQGGNFAFSWGLFDNVEVGGRVSEIRSLDANGSKLGEIRDLSGNIKIRLLDNPHWPQIAVGAGDFAGDAPNFRTTYVVSSYERWNVRATAGYGFGPDRLDGAFGALEFRPSSYLSAKVERDDLATSYGFRASTGTLIQPFKLSLLAKWQEPNSESTQPTQLELNQDMNIGIELSMPISLHRTRSRVSEPHDAKTADPYRVAPPPAATDRAQRSGPNQGRLQAALLDRLDRAGFEHAYVGYRAVDDEWLVAAESARHNWSALDEIGLAMGVIATTPGIRGNIRLRLRDNGVALLEIAAPASDYIEFLDAPERNEAALARSLTVRWAPKLPSDIEWFEGHIPRRTAVALKLSPTIRTFVATEVGNLDYSAGARVTSEGRSGNGIYWFGEAILPLVETDDFEDGGNYEPFGLEARLDTVGVAFLRRFSPNWFSLTSAGLAHQFQASVGEFSHAQGWRSDSGAHQVDGRIGLTFGSGGSEASAIVGYTWFDAQRDLALSLRGGRFEFGDSGLRGDLTRYFGDTAVNLFVKGSGSNEMAGGIGFSLPLTPRQEPRRGSVSFGGARRFSYGLQTTFNREDETNALRPGFLQLRRNTFDLQRDVLDSGRLTPNYVRTHLLRLAEAYYVLID